MSIFVAVYSGIGTQWNGMGQDLMDKEPDFALGLREFDNAFSVFSGWSVEEALYSKPTDITQAYLGHPCIIGVSFGLVRLMQGKGIFPSMHIGHSGGEVVAAWASGVLSIHDAALVAYNHSEVIRKAKGQGTMLHLSLPFEQLQPLLDELSTSVEIAAYNSPHSIVCSGSAEALSILEQKANALMPKSARLLRVDVPFHSQSITNLLNEFADGLAGLQPAIPHTPIISSLHGRTADVETDKDFGTTYWVNHIKEPVHFADAVTTALQQGIRNFVEIAPHAVLQAALSDTATSLGISIQSTAMMARNTEGCPSTASALSVITAWDDEVREKETEQNAQSRRLSSLSPKQRTKEISAVIRDALHSLLPETLATAFPAEAPFLSLGLTSALAVRFAAIVSSKTGLHLPVSSIFSLPNINMLTDHLDKMLKKTSAGTSNTARQKNTTCRSDHSIAVVGFSCQFPGGVSDEKTYWNLLTEGKDAVIPIPATRWDREKYYHPDKNHPGTMYTKESAFLTTPVDEFDPFFFNISAKEARQMDPQQRMLMELSWRAFEHAAINPGIWCGKKVGVFLGMTNTEYSHAHRESYQRERIDAYSLTGTSLSGACGRLSYFYGFEGPCWSVDTACSSGLVALHCACQSLLQGESDMALLGSVTLMLTPDLHICFTKLGAISPDGRSKAFDDGANGYGRGEGGAVILLKRLEDAKRDGDEIWGVLKGTAINQDGKSNGLTAPNGLSQQKVIEQSLEKAGKSPLDITYVEAHGTGTTLGDSIELDALAAAYCQTRSPATPLKIGSVKANIGHLEPVAALASLIKILLCMRNRAIPANIHVKKPNSQFDFASKAIHAPTKLEKWEQLTPLCAGISAFGFSGVNGHAIIEEYCQVLGQANGKSNGQPVIRQTAKTASDILFMPLSAKTPEALRLLAEHTAHRLDAMDREKAAALCRRMAISRQQFSVRLFGIGSTPEELAASLRQAEITTAPATVEPPVILFTGQGSQYPEMGRVLYEQYPVFKDALETTFSILSRHSFDAKSLLFGGATAKDLENTAVAQPLIVAISYALSKLWESFGLTFSAAAGHSIGEYPAAVTCGVMELEDMLALALARGKAMQEAPEGSMAVVFAEMKALRPFLAEYPVIVAAAFNSPGNVTLAGPDKDIENLLALLQSQNIQSKRLHVSKAYHSPSMEAASLSFADALKGVRLRLPQIPFVSTVSGQADDTSITSHKYWEQQIIRPVRFSEALQTLCTYSNVAVEAGPSAALSGIVGTNGLPLKAIPSLSPTKKDLHPLFSAVGKLFVSGYDLDFRAVFAPFPSLCVDTVPYPFQREVCWMPVVNDPPYSTKTNASGAGTRLNSPALGKSAVFESLFDEKSPYFVWEHIIFDKAISPAAGHMAMLLAAAKDLWGHVSCELTNVDFLAPLVVEKNAPRLVQIIIENTTEQVSSFHLLSRPAMDDEFAGSEAPWQSHCTGTIAPIGVAQPEATKPVPGLMPQENFGTPMSKEDFYQCFVKRGYAVGAGFQRIENIRITETQAQCRVLIREKAGDHPEHVIYPGSLDSVLQTILPSQLMGLLEIMQEEDALFIPLHVDRLSLWTAFPDMVFCESDAHRSAKDGILEGNVLVRDAQGNAVMQMAGCAFRMTDYGTLYKGLGKKTGELVYSNQWQEFVMPAVPSSPEEVSDFRFFPLGTSANPAIWPKNKQLDPTNPADSLRSLPANVQDIFIVHTPADQASSPLSETTETMALITGEKEEQTCLALMRIFQEYTPLNHPFRLHLVTHGVAYEVTRETLSPEAISTNATENKQGSQKEKASLHYGVAGASLVGLAEVFALEHPGSLISITDLPLLSDSEKKDKTRLDTPLHSGSQANYPQIILDSCALLAFSSEPARIALRGSRSYQKKLTKAPTFREGKQRPFSGAHFISGGTGALGLKTAVYLANQGADCIALFSRSGRAPETSVVEAITASGCKLLLLQGDICSAQNVSQALEKVRKEGLPLRGVFHAAGVLDDSLLDDMDESRLLKVLRPKIYGALLLNSLTSSDNLNFFVCYSSAGSLIGSQGQANYNAANHFMNALCQYRSVQGNVGSAPCFGPWAEAGMAQNETIRRNLRQQGILLLEPDDALEGLFQAAQQGYGVFGVMDVDWARFASHRDVDAEGMFSLLPISRHETDTSSQKGSSGFFEGVCDETGQPDPARLLEALRQTAAKVLGIADAARVLPDTPLMEYGFDSLMAVEFRNAIAKGMQRQVPVSITFEYPTLEKICGWFTEQGTPEEAANRVKSIPPTTKGFEEVQTLLDDIESLLND